MNNEEAVTTWLRQNAMPIQYIEAGHGFDDLQPLNALLKDVQVVGLGEATHGTREFFQFKHRLLEFLVTEMGFTELVIEGSYTGFQPINDYILHGTGDPASVLTGQGYVVWDTEELAAMVAWMRAYNQRVPDDKKVRLHGVDSFVNDLARPAILAYLINVGSARVAATESLFAALAREEAKWPACFDEGTPAIVAGLLPQFDELIAYLTDNQAAFVECSSPENFESALQYTRVIWQWLICMTPEALRPADLRSKGRNEFMPENMMTLIDRDKPDTKYIVWAHNGHVCNGNLQTGRSNWGSQLRERFGNSYYGFAFDFNQGLFHTRTKLPDKGLGDLKAVTLPPAPDGTWPWYLSGLKCGDLLLNLRGPVDNPDVAAWLSTPRKMRDAGWFYIENAADEEMVIATDKYDGIIFIERTTPSCPTANAQKTIAARAGL